MRMVEDTDMNFYWECDFCETRFQDRDDFDQSKECPNCTSKITAWKLIVSYEEEDEEFDEEFDEEEDEDE